MGWLGAAVLSAGITTACEPPVGPISDDVYVEAMSLLTHVHSSYLDAALADSARKAVWEELAVRPQDLEEFAEVFGADPQKMFDISERIRARVESLDAAHSRALRQPGEVPPDPPDPEDGR